VNKYRKIILNGDDLTELVIDKTKTALVVIDSQKGITAQPTKSYPERDVIDNAAKLVDMFRKKDAGTSSACHYAKDNAKVVSN
jgi:nicotinamidase-related amidase